jgi:predicted extracellular nuclease
MSKVRHLLSSGSFTQDWSNAALITANNDWSGVASIVGYRGDDVITATGVDPRTILAASTSEVVENVVANQVNPNTVSTGGVIEFDAIPNRTIALNGSGTADAPSIVVYLDATGRENVRFQANIRDIDGSADNAIQQVAVQWRVGGGNWENAAYVADATEAGTATKVTAIDLVLPAGANNAADLEVRVITTNAVGNDEAVGIDDITVSSQPAQADVTPPTLAAFNPSDPDDGAVAVEANTNIVLRFSESVQAGTGGFTLSNGTDNRFIAIGNPQLTITGNTITIDPATDLVAGTTYTLTANAGVVEDAAGNDFGGLAAGALDFTVANPLQAITIGEIQGLGHRSGYVNAKVRTEGVVTAVDTIGYYIQSATGQSDGDARTSDGIFVFGSTAGIAKGDLLRIDATVSEFRPGGDTRNLTITQLVSPTVAKLGTAAFEQVVLGQGGLLPPTAVIDDDGLTSYDPASDGIDFWESLEGMYITVDKPIAVSNTNDFGETYIVASGGAGATGMSAAGGITLSEGDYNPERLQLDQDTGLFGGFDNELSIGDRATDVKGVISYAFQSYELLVTEAVTVTQDVTLEREFTMLQEADDKLSVADYNLENLSAVDSMDKFYSLASDIVYNLNAPDILAVQEIQDADGAGTGSDLSGVPTANMLIQAILDMGGPQYAYVEVAPSAPNSTGGEPNGNIRNGYFYDPSRVTLVDGSVQLINDPIYNGTRRPLAASFEFNGETVTLVNVHSTSRLGSDPLYGAQQPPADAGDGARTAQAQGVRNWIDAKLAVDPAAKIAVVGDFNGFTWENAIKALTNGGKLQDLNILLPEEERYSYMFDGNQQQIDHIIATTNLLQVAEFDNVHLNAQQPDNLQLSTDHDAVIAVFQLGGGANALAANPDAYDYAAPASFAAFRNPDAWHVMLP